MEPTIDWQKFNPMDKESLKKVERGVQMADLLKKNVHTLEQLDMNDKKNLLSVLTIGTIKNAVKAVHTAACKTYCAFTGKEFVPYQLQKCLGLGGCNF